MFNIKNAIINNRTNSTAIKSAAIEKDDIDTFNNWKKAVEVLRIAVSNYAVADRQDNNNTELENAVFEAYKTVLAFFTNKSLGEKVKPQATDLRSMLTFIGAKKKAEKDAKQKEFLPVGSSKFRKELEDFIVDRLQKASYHTAESVEAERKERNAKNKAARKAKKELAKKAETKAA